MIGVGAPWILGSAITAALITCALHFLSVRRPPVLMLPTMRFLPDRPVRAVSRSTKPSDLLLLLMRVAAILLIGAALSGLYWRAAGVKHGRVVVIQRSSDTGVSAVAAMRQSAAQALAGAFAGDTATRVVVIDSIAHVLSASESRAFNPETLSVMPGAQRQEPGMSAALLSAARAAGELVREERNVDVVDLAVSAPINIQWMDAGVPDARTLWSGKIRLFNAQPTPDSVAATGRMTLALVGDAASDAVRSELEARGLVVPVALAANAAANAGRATPITVEWPASGAPQGWTTSTAATIGAVVARGEALVYPFVRTSVPPASIVSQARAIAWWSDGEVAALEVPTASSCTRHVGIPVPASSNVLQGTSARALIAALSAPCGGDRSIRALSDEQIIALQGAGDAAAASVFRSDNITRTPYAWVLLVLAIGLLIAEWFVRGREDRGDVAVDANAESLRRVA